MGAHLWAMDADPGELNMSVPKIPDIPEASPRCRLRTSRISKKLAAVYSGQNQPPYAGSVGAQRRRRYRCWVEEEAELGFERAA
jgi:hypothetical protein